MIKLNQAGAQNFPPLFNNTLKIKIMSNKERMAGLIDSFINDMSIKYNPAQRGVGYQEIEVYNYGLKDDRSPLKARSRS